MVTFGLNSASFLAQVNFGTNPASLLGIFLAVAGPALYFIRFIRPGLERDQDIFFAAIGLVCGFILIFQGWRLDPILQFGQLLLIGTTVFFAFESVRLRGIATEQAKRNTKIVDDDRRVSDRYSYDRDSRYAEVDAELDPLPYEYDEERPVRGRIRGSAESRPNRDDYYEDETPRRSERRSNSERIAPTDKPRRRSTNGGRTTNRNVERLEEEDWGSGSSRTVDNWDSSPSDERRSSRRGTNNSPRDREDDVAPRPRKRRPPTDSVSRASDPDDAMPTEYVDYKPLDRLDEDPPERGSSEY